MASWLRILGPGVALVVVGVLLMSRPAVAPIGQLLGMIGFIWVIIAGPIYKRHWRARRRAHDWHLTKQAKARYK